MSTIVLQIFREFTRFSRANTFRRGKSRSDGRLSEPESGKEITNETFAAIHVILDQIFQYLDLPSKKNCRLVCELWRDILDRKYVIFIIQPGKNPESIQVLEDAVVLKKSLNPEATIGKSFVLVMSYYNFKNWTPETFSRLTNLGSELPKLKELHFDQAYYYDNDNTESSVDSIKTYHLLRDPQIKKCILYLLEFAETEYLNIELRGLFGFFQSELNEVLSRRLVWSTLGGLEFYIDSEIVTSYLPVIEFLKYGKCPVLTDFVMWQEHRFVEEYLTKMDDFLILLSKFIFSHRRTLKDFGYHVASDLRIPDLSASVPFLRDQLNLEKFCLLTISRRVDGGVLQMRWFGSILISGSKSLRSFELIEVPSNPENDFENGADEDQLNQAKILPDDLVQTLLVNGHNLTGLTLGLETLNIAWLRRCTKLRNLGLRSFKSIIGMEETLNLDRVTEFTLDSSKITEDFVGWIFREMPNLLSVIVKCSPNENRPPESLIIPFLKFPFLREIKIEECSNRESFAEYCSRMPGLTLTKHGEDLFIIHIDKSVSNVSSRAKRFCCIC